VCYSIPFIARLVSARTVFPPVIARPVELLEIDTDWGKLYRTEVLWK